METVCAFSNEPNMGGGYLLLGVEEQEQTLFPTFVPQGIVDIDKLTNDLLTQCRSSFNLPLAPRITPEKIGDKLILKVFVPEVPVTSKPICFKEEGLPRGAFRRVGSADVHCSEDDLLVFYGGRSSHTFDADIVIDADMTDIDLEAVEDYRKEREKTEPEAPELSWNDVDLLRALGCVRLEAEKARPTVAGILLFVTKMALRREFPLMRVDYIRVPGREWVRDLDKRFDTIEIRDPLMRAVRRAQAAVMDDLPSAFLLPEGEVQRQPQPVVSSRVWREVIVNALMHRDYRKQGAVQIIRYSNRLEIRNPGYSLKAEEQLGEPESLTRNPKIAAVLHETRFAETKGSGVRVMRDLMERANLTPPVFESNRGLDKFTATFLFHHFLSEEDWSWLGHYQSLNLSSEEANALVFVRESGAINNSVYRTLNKMDALDASVHLRRLCAAALLAKKGGGSGTFYVPGSKFKTDFAREINTSSKRSYGPLSEELTPQIKALPEELAPQIKALPEELTPSLVEEMPLSLKKKVEEWRGTPRAKPEEVRMMIELLCSWRPLSGGQLASLLGRNLSYLVSVYLSSMVRDGVLQHTHPDSPRHPQQSYKST